MTPNSRFEPHSTLTAPHRREDYAVDRTLEISHIAAIRRARATLLDAARRAESAEIEAAVAPFVTVMWEADFSRQTISSLVAAAIDAGLPSCRGAARRARRDESIAHWVVLAERLADELLRYR